MKSMTGLLRSGSAPSRMVRMMAATPAAPEMRTFQHYGIFKGKAAINVKHIAPTFVTSSTGTSRTLEREGTLLLEFAPATDKPKEYDWTKKITFGLDATECSEFTLLDQTKTIEFMHDPHAMTPEAGKTTKKLKIAPMPDQKSVYFTLTVTNKGEQPTSVALPVSWAEVETVKNVCRFLVPRMLGFDKE